MIAANDEWLLHKAREGDKSAFEEFYQRHKKQIYTYIYRLVRSRELAEELAQDTFIRAYTHLDLYSAKGKPLGWLYTIAGNTAKNALKRQTRRSEVSLDAPLEDSNGQLNLLDVLESLKTKPYSIISSKELAVAIQEAIDSLDFAHRQVLLLCDVQGQSYQDVANILGCKSNTVGSRLFRAREKIAKKLASIYKEKPRKFFKWKNASFLQKDYPVT